MYTCFIYFNSQSCFNPLKCGALFRKVVFSFNVNSNFDVWFNYDMTDSKYNSQGQSIMCKLSYVRHMIQNSKNLYIFFLSKIVASGNFEDWFTLCLYFVLPNFKNFPLRVRKILPNVLHLAANCPTLPFTLLTTAILMFAYVYAQNI